ncbi:shikimate kinase [Neolewinella persica]|uniref:shikimate kinase n=1 Tax=Neolewinella persica TaxID=70998 RepID=UPI000367CD91|nr:shikimate kinase [Neolewinella persica]
MGCGKSYVGSRLAIELGVPFIDLDAEIEGTAGKSISAIFAEAGEAAFRRLETEALRATAALPAFVLATGGGAPCFHDNMAWMNANGTTVFLDPDLEVLLDRLEAGRDHRPLLQSGTALRKLVVDKLADRRPIYEQAAIHLHGPEADGDVACTLVNRF